MSHTVGVQLPGFTESTFTHDGITRPVYAGGTGPAVDRDPRDARAAPAGRRRSRSGSSTPGSACGCRRCSATPGRAVERRLHDRRRIAQACVAKEFVGASRSTAPARSSAGCARSAAEAHAECGGPGVGAVGMCFTGGFALGMMVDDTMLAPVLSQPSLPFPVSASRTARGRHQRRRPRPGEGARRGRRLPPRAALHRRHGGAAGALRDAAPRARRRVHRGGDRLVEGQPARHPARRALGAHPALRRRARSPDPRRARPGARVLRRAAAAPPAKR